MAPRLFPINSRLTAHQRPGMKTSQEHFAIFNNVCAGVNSVGGADMDLPDAKSALRHPSQADQDQWIKIAGPPGTSRKPE